MQKIGEIEGKLVMSLGGEEKELFLDFVNAHDEIRAVLEVEYFSCGFQLGAQITANSLQNEIE